MLKLFALLNIDKVEKKYLKIQSGGQGYQYTEDLQQPRISFGNTDYPSFLGIWFF